MAKASWWDKHYLAAQLWLSFLLAIGAWLWLDRWTGWSLLAPILHGNRSAVYGALASIYGSLFGFIIAAVAIVMGHVTTPRFDLVRKSSEFPKLLKTFTAAIWALGLATLAALAALVLDRDQSHQPVVFYLLLFASSLALLRIGTAIRLLEKVIHLAAATPK